LNIVSKCSGYWSSARRIESFDCFNCGSVLMDWSKVRICFAVIEADMLYCLIRVLGL
jgi:hypothetical protein